ncbi:hypothetical protein B0H10DRAFT_2211724 [Mycena sp. CBHHK59/15]|nr:hypothetical protein B0H10DRAFT_2211724 [Mycena sp. CBHHK59/15]
MAKKNKDEAPNASNIVNKDIMQRLNFMYQASVYLSGVLPVSPPEPSSAPLKRRKKSRKMTVHDLSKSYINSMKVVANKTMVKMDPAVKRTLCNGCNIVLVPGSTAVGIAWTYYDLSVHFLQFDPPHTGASCSRRLPFL